MFTAFELAGVNVFEKMGSEEDLWRFSKSSRAAGVTTAAELFSPLHDDVVTAMTQVTNQPDFPLRLVVSKSATTANPEIDINRINDLKKLNHDKLRFGSIKIMTDGSIQGFTARLKEGKYYNGAPNGIWNAPPEEIVGAIGCYHAAGIKLHIHTNGDEAIELAIDAIKAANDRVPDKDINHYLQHAQLITLDMLERCSGLGIGVNFFANHIYYWGDQHASMTIGPKRARKLNPVMSAIRSGVKCAIHSDAPITPLSPLFTAWCAMNRLTATNFLLGKDELISIDEALYSITMGAAISLDIDADVGSIEVGKFADFSILNSDPYEIAKLEIKDIEVYGIVLGGECYLN